MKKNTMFYMISLLLNLTGLKSMQAQSLKACDITSVAAVNKAIGSNLVFDPASVVNKTGKFECRYTDPKLTGSYVAIGLIDAKVQFGYDMLKSDFDTNKKTITDGHKAGGKYSHIYAFPKAGPLAYYMTGDKDDFSPEAFIFTCRKGNYIVSFSAANISLNTLLSKVDEIYDLFTNL